MKYVVSIKSVNSKNYLTFIKPLEKKETLTGTEHLVCIRLTSTPKLDDYAIRQHLYHLHMTVSNNSYCINIIAELVLRLLYFRLCPTVNDNNFFSFCGTNIEISHSPLDSEKGNLDIGWISITYVIQVPFPETNVHHRI